MTATHRAQQPVTPQPPKASRAGRNLPAAIGVGVGLGGIIVASLFLYRAGFVVVLAITVSLAVWELATSIRQSGAHPPVVPLIVGGLAIEAVAWFKGSEALAVTFLLTCLAVAVWRLADGPDGYLRDVSTGLFVALYVPFLAGFAVLLTVPDDGPRRVVAFIATVACSDVGGYATGVFLGKHPMAPRISPAKSWEGFAGSVVFCTGAGVAFFTLMLDHAAWQGAIFGAALAATATLGDLGESLLKRDLGVKDMGTLLPGHGGVMDRLDSMLPGAVVAYLLLTAFIPVH
jgi:phosphatidate cytidylyltransferase